MRLLCGVPDCRRVAGPSRRTPRLGRARPMRARRGPQDHQCGALHPPRIGADQANPAPEIRLPRWGERGDRRGDPEGVGTLHEPEAPPQALVEGPSGVAGEPGGDLLPVHASAPSEVALVKAIAVDRQPAQQGVEPRQQSLDAKAEPAQHPADAHVHHVDVGRPGTFQECRQSVPPPGHEVIQQGKPHRRPLERKSPEFGLNGVQPEDQCPTFTLLQSRVIAMQEDSPDPFQSLPHLGFDLPKPAPSKRRFLG